MKDIKATHVNKHFSARAQNWIRVIKGELHPSFSSYIKPSSEEKFIEEVLKHSARECARYLTFRVYHYLKSVHTVNLQKFVLVWQKERDGPLWLTNCFIYKANHENHSFKKVSELQLNRRLLSNPFIKGAQEIMNNDIHRKTRDYIKKHYFKVKALCQLYNIPLPKPLDDKIHKSADIFKSFYKDTTTRIEDALKNNPEENHEEIAFDLLKETIEQTFPKLAIALNKIERKESFLAFKKNTPEENSTRLPEGNSVFTEYTLRTRDLKVKIRTDKTKPLRVQKVSNSMLSNINGFLKTKMDNGFFSRFNKTFATKMTATASEASLKEEGTFYLKLSQPPATPAEESAFIGDILNQKNKEVLLPFGETNRSETVTPVATKRESRTKTGDMKALEPTKNSSTDYVQIPVRPSKGKTLRGTAVDFFKTTRKGYLGAELMGRQSEQQYSLPKLLKS